MSKYLALFLFTFILIAVQPLSSSATEPDGFIARKALSMEALELLQKRDFSKLEEMAKHFRKTKERFPDGAWKLQYFYEGFGEQSFNILKTDNAWLKTIGNIEEWQQHFPKSPTPKVALANAWIGYAWFARGKNFANKVKPERWELFRDRIARAANILRDKTLDKLCPHVWALRLQIAKTPGIPREDFERLFRAAISFEPRYHAYYAAAITYYSDEWFGEPGEWVKQLERFHKIVPKGEGIYARVASGLQGREWSSFKEGTISWERIKESLAELPDGSPWVDNMRASLACTAGDKSMALPILQRIGSSPYYKVWVNPFQYGFCRRWLGLSPLSAPVSMETRYLKVLSDQGNEWAKIEFKENIEFEKKIQQEILDMPKRWDSKSR
jgi:hypothetical protein